MLSLLIVKESRDFCLDCFNSTEAVVIDIPNNLNMRNSRFHEILAKNCSFISVLLIVYVLFLGSSFALIWGKNERYRGEAVGH